MRTSVYHGEVNLEYILRPAKKPSNVLVVAFPGAGGVNVGGANTTGFTYMLTISAYNVNALFLKSDMQEFSKSQMTAKNRDFIIERTVDSLIKQACADTGSTRIIVVGSSMGGMCSVYYGLKYGYDLIACSPKYEHPSAEYCAYTAGGTTPECFAWYHSLMSGAVRTAGARKHDKFIYLCWGRGEGNWTDKNQGPKMLKALDAQKIKYTYELYDYASHTSVHLLFPQVLKHQLGVCLGVINESEITEETQTDTQKVAAQANRFKHNFAIADGLAPIADEHSADVKNLQLITKFEDYIVDLNLLKEKITVIMAVNDSCAPHAAKNGYLKLLSDNFGTQDISTLFRYSYLVIIDGGEVKAELSSATEAVRTGYHVGSVDLLVESCGFNQEPPFARVFIGEAQKAVNLRGLNILVLDKGSGKLIDSVNFDTYADTKDCCRFKGLSQFVSELNETEPNYHISNRFNHGDMMRTDIMLRTFVYALQGYHWLPKQSAPTRHGPGNFWQTIVLKNNSYANSFWFQATVLNHYKATGEPLALALVADNLTEFFPLADLIRRATAKDYYHWWTATCRTEALIDFACVANGMDIGFTDWKNLQKEIVIALDVIVNAEIMPTDINGGYFRLFILLMLAELFKKSTDFYSETYSRVMKTARTLTDYYFDDNGVCIYEQARIQHYILPYIKRIVDFIESNGFPDSRDFKKLKRKYAIIEEATSHMVRNDGVTPALGQTDLSKVTTKPASGNFVRPASNIAVLSDDLTYITIHGGSNVHSAYRHCDLLSFTFHYDGRQIVFDAGGGNGNLADYARSAVAHSALLCDEFDYITPDYFDFSAMDDAVERDDYVFVAAKHMQIEGVTLKRYTVWIKPNLVVLYDEAVSSEEHLYTQNFLLPAVAADDADKSSITLKLTPDYAVNIAQLQPADDPTVFNLAQYSGTMNANADAKDLRGSRIKEFKTPEQLLNLAYEKRGTSVKFLTVIEAHSGRDAEVKFDTAAVEGGKISVTATCADKTISVFENLDRGFALF